MKTKIPIRLISSVWVFVRKKRDWIAWYALLVGMVLLSICIVGATAKWLPTLRWCVGDRAADVVVAYVVLLIGALWCMLPPQPDIRALIEEEDD